MSIPKGYGSVFVRVFNPSGSEAFERVTRLTYNHSDKSSDYSTIVIETQDFTLPDHPDLQEHKVLVLVWGYLGGKTRTHRVYIWDVKCNFTESGLRMEIIAYCRLAYLSLTSSKDVYNDMSMSDIAQEIAGGYGFNYKEEGLEDAPTEEPKIEAEVTGTQEGAILNLKTQQVTVARDMTSYVQYRFKKYDKGVAQAGGSDKKLLDNLASTEPTENLFVDGHDDDLIIRKRNFKQAPYKSYIFKQEPGHLLKFIPGSHNSKNQKGSVSNTVTGWLEDQKEYIEGQINSSHSGAGILGDVVTMPTEEIVRQKIYKDIESPLDQPKTVNGFFTEEYDGQDENGNPRYKRLFTEKLDSTKTNWLHITKRGTRPSQLDLQKNFVSSAIDVTGRLELNGFVPVTPKEVINTIEDNKKDIAGVGVNRQSEKESELYEASADVLGDPELQSAKVISILNVSAKYSGNYYVSCVTHEVVPESGYLCYLSLLRNGLSRIESEGVNKIDGAALDRTKNIRPGLAEDGTPELFNISVIED